MRRLLVLVVVSFLAVACDGDNADTNINQLPISTCANLNGDDRQDNVEKFKKSTLSMFEKGVKYYAKGGRYSFCTKNGNDLTMILHHPPRDMVYSYLEAEVVDVQGDRYIAKLIGGEGYYVSDKSKVNNSYIVFYIRQLDDASFNLAIATKVEGDKALTLAAGRGNFASIEQAKRLAQAPDQLSVYTGDMMNYVNLWMPLTHEQEDVVEADEFLAFLDKQEKYFVIGQDYAVTSQTGNDLELRLYAESGGEIARLETEIVEVKGDRYIAKLVNGTGSYVANTSKINNSYIVFYIRPISTGGTKIAIVTNNGLPLENGAGNFDTREQARLAQAPNENMEYSGDKNNYVNLWMVLSKK